MGSEALPLENILERHPFYIYPREMPSLKLQMYIFYFKTADDVIDVHVINFNEPLS